MEKPSTARKRRLLWVLLPLACLGLLYFVLTTVIREISQPQLFHPSRDEVAHATLMMRSNTEFIVIPTDQGELSGFMHYGSNGAAPLVLYFGGNGDNAAGRIRYLADTRSAIFRGWHLAMIDYPSYGLSEGTPGDASFRRMALAAYDALAAREDVTGIVVMGYSIGTGRQITWPPGGMCPASSSWPPMPRERICSTPSWTSSTAL